MKPMSCKSKSGQGKTIFIVTHEFKNVATTCLYPPILGIFTSLV